MLDINLFREDKGGNLDIVRESQRRRYKDVGVVDEIAAMDVKWREVKAQLDTLRMEFNKLNKSIADKRKAKEDTTAEQEQSKGMKEDIKKKEDEEKGLIEAMEAKILPMGNLVHDSVPISDNEDNNRIERTWGECRTEEKLYNHVDLVQLLDIVSLDEGSEVAGGRGYFLKNEGVLLNQALINCAMQFLYKKGYGLMHTPFFMRKSVMAKCAQLEQFDEELYHVTGEGEDKYLIATSEQTLCAYFAGKWFERRELPQRYCGYSTCFRKEAGSHGRDTLGIFRVHQFEKVEQFVLTSADGDESWAMQEEMIKNSEEFYQALGLPYRVVNICSGALNNAAARKFDLEAWFPASKTYRELVSCSNCTDYQSRRLEVRLRGVQTPGQEAKKEHVHMLNSTLTATERTLCCVLENYQTPEGVRIPEFLRPFMCGVEFLPFRKTYDAKGKLVPRAPAPAASAMSTESA